jgi:hypothetical protein
MQEMSQVDPVTLSTIWHGLQSTCREMRTLVQRSAQSHIIALLGDISAGLWDGQGRTVAVPIGLPAQYLGGNFSVRYLLDDVGDDLAPGDVFLCNDPYRGYNLHLPDWGFFRPIFYKDELLFWTPGAPTRLATSRMPTISTPRVFASRLSKSFLGGKRSRTSGSSSGTTSAIRMP